MVSIGLTRKQKIGVKQKISTLFPPHHPRKGRLTNRPQTNLGGAPSTVKHFRSKIRKKSGNTPEMLSEQILNFQTLGNKAYSLPRLVSELCYPQYGWYRFHFWRGPLHATARAGHGILNSTGGTADN